MRSVIVMKIAIDLDEVLGDFIKAFLHWYNYNYNAKLSKDDIVAYHLSDLFNISVDEEIQIIHRMLSEDGVVQLEPIRGAKEAVKKLAQKHELYLVSARPEYLRSQTEEWIKKHFAGLFKGIYLTNQSSIKGGREVSKGYICKKLGCNVLIDDGSHHIESVTKAGAKVIILNRPWNSYHRFPKYIMRANNWDEIIRIINKIAKQYV